MKVLSICGSPRKGNCEALVLRIQKLLQKRGVENEVVLLREKKIETCRGCEEYCSKKSACVIKDDMQEILPKMVDADAYIFASPNYFNMPTGLFKDFIDRCCARSPEVFSNKKAVAIVVGGDKPEAHGPCLDNIANNFCQAVGMKVVGRKAFQGNSDLKGNPNDIFENGYNPNLEKDLQELVQALIS